MLWMDEYTHELVRCDESEAGGRCRRVYNVVVNIV
jgi:hypothetical protein